MAEPEQPHVHEPYIPPPAEAPPRIPRVEDFPPVAQRQIEARRGEGMAAEEDRGPMSLLRRLANVGLGRREEDAAAAPAPRSQPSAAAAGATSTGAAGAAPSGRSAVAAAAAGPGAAAPESPAGAAALPAGPGRPGPARPAAAPRCAPAGRRTGDSGFPASPGKLIRGRSADAWRAGLIRPAKLLESRSELARCACFSAP